MKNIKKKYSIPVSSFRNLPSPYGEYSSEKIKNPIVYECYVEIQDLPNDFPMETNPREQNLKTKVSKNIKDSLFEDNENFHIKNRGIVLSAAEVIYNNRGSSITINMNDCEVHGNIDGGHTYRIILDNRSEVIEKTYVRLEIITGAEVFFQDLAKARNTSVQVKDTSIAELEKKFDLIKEPLSHIGGRNLNNEIAFKENESDKRISVENIISILYSFNIDEFDSAEKQPVVTYSQKNYCIKQYLNLYDKMNLSKNSGKINPFVKMKNIIPDILDLYEYIETTLHEKYKEAEPNGKYGALKGVQTKKEGSKNTFNSEILATELEYKSSRSFILPILSAFRALVGENENHMYYWKKDPKKYYKLLGGQMIKNTKDRSRTLGNNPNALGKDVGHWRDLYNLVDLEYKNDLIKELQAHNK